MRKKYVKPYIMATVIETGNLLIDSDPTATDLTGGGQTGPGGQETDGEVGARGSGHNNFIGILDDLDNEF